MDLRPVLDLLATRMRLVASPLAVSLWPRDPAEMPQLQLAQEDPWTSGDLLQTKLYFPREELEQTARFAVQTGLDRGDQ